MFKKANDTYLTGNLTAIILTTCFLGACGSYQEEDSKYFNEHGKNKSTTSVLNPSPTATSPSLNSQPASCKVALTKTSYAYQKGYFLVGSIDSRCLVDGMKGFLYLNITENINLEGVFNCKSSKADNYNIVCEITGKPSEYKFISNNKISIFVTPQNDKTKDLKIDAELQIGDEKANTVTSNVMNPRLTF